MYDGGGDGIYIGPRPTGGFVIKIWADATKLTDGYVSSRI